MKNSSELIDLSFDFALGIVTAYKKIVMDSKEYVLSKQLLKSGTSIGANIREAYYAQSKADFISKMSIALKEANETEYWILLMTKSKILDEESEMTIRLNTQNKSIIRMLISTVKTAKQNN